MSGANITASLTLKLQALGEQKLSAVVAKLDQVAVAAAKDGSRLKGVQEEIAKVASKAPGLRTLEQELVKLGRNAEQTKIKMAAAEIFNGPAGAPPIIAKLRTVENEMQRLERMAENKKVTGAARKNLGMDGGLFGGLLAGHGFMSTTRQTIGLLRDLTVASVGVAHVIGGTFHKVLDPVKEFQNSMADIRNKGGFNVAQMGAIADAAKRVSTTKGLEQFSPTQAASAGVELAAAGLDAQGVAGSMPTVLRFSQASRMGTEESAGMLVDTMAQFSKTPADFENIGNAIVKAANMSTISVHDVGESMKYVGPIAHTAGMSLEKTAGYIAFLGERGQKGSEGGTALRKVLTSLVHPTRQAKEAMKALGLSKKEMQAGLDDLPGFLRKIDAKMAAHKFDKAQRLEANKLLFGTEGLVAAELLTAGAKQVGTDGKDAIDAYTDAIVNAKDEMKNAAAIAGDTLGGSFSKVNAKIETMMINIGEKLAPKIEQLIDKLTPFIDKIATFLGQSGSAVEVGTGALGVVATTALTPGKGKLIGLAGKAATGVVGAEGTAAVGAMTEAITGASGVVATVVAIAKLAIPVILAGAAGYGLGKLAAHAMGDEKMGSFLYDIFHGTAKAEDVDPALKALEKQRAEKKAAAAEAEKKTEGEIKISVADDRVNVKTVSRSGSKLRTGRNAQ